MNETSPPMVLAANLGALPASFWITMPNEASESWTPNAFASLRFSPRNP